ncbi:MAG: MBL fold metallo-hydrolase [Rhizobiaceae bacterium]
MGKPAFSAKIWGARGTLASDSKSTVRYGGNTACVEIACGDQRLIFDAGSGLRAIGDSLMKEAKKLDRKGLPRKPINLFFTHCHYDHISGLPFFAPFFDPNAKVDIWSGHLEGPDKTRKMIENYMKPPYFPVGPEVFSADISYRDFDVHDVLKPVSDIVIKTLPLNHHDNCVGYRIEFDSRSICYITDTTHVVDEPDQGIIDFVDGTDLMIYDGTYTDEEFPMFWNFGHSTWEEGVRLSKTAGVKRYCVFHHRPSRSDDELDKISAQCKQVFRRSWFGYEGLKIRV